MGKFIRLFLFVCFILSVSVTPLLAKSGGGGNGWGGGTGGGRGHGVPEIDPSLAPSAIALLAGGLLIVRSKSGKKVNKA